MEIPLSNPDITDLERKYVNSVLHTPHLSLGPILPKFERAFAEYIGSRYAIAVNSGTSGLHLLIKATGVSKGNVVITTPFSFVASSNAILFEGGEPLFVDIDPITYNIDVSRIEKAIEELGEKSSDIKALLPVHVFGVPCDMEKMTDIAEKYHLALIEDSCEAVGSEYQKRKAGTIGNGGVFAFYPNKQMTTGEGGMIVTDDENIAGLCRSLRNQGRSENGGWLAHERLGYNYRLSDINCALGLAQLERIDEILEKRSHVAKMYEEKLKGVAGVNIPYSPENDIRSWFVYVIRLDNEYTRDDRDRIMRGLVSKGIGCNNYFVPIHLQPFYQKMFGYKLGDFPITEHVAERTIALPFYNNLREEEIDYIVTQLKDFV